MSCVDTDPDSNKKNYCEKLFLRCYGKFRLRLNTMRGYQEHITCVVCDTSWRIKAFEVFVRGAYWVQTGK